jgi:S-formylglutathione hydrolase FrmB
MPPVVVVMPDCYTSLGGNQYVNSLAVGRYAEYLVSELLPFISSQVNVIDGRKGRGLFGKSSGGFGALHHGMKYSHAWGAVASHAGDLGFDLVYRPAFPATCAALAEFDGDVTAFVRSFWNKNNPSSQDYSALMIVAMAASYDPDPGQPQGIRLPFDRRTCALDETRWAQWLQFDPLNLGPADVHALKNLHGLYIDVGSQDQYHIQYGSRAFTDKLKHHGVEHRYEEFRGGHTAIDWRLDYSLPFLAQVLKKAALAAT